MRRLLIFVCLVGLQFGLLSSSEAGGWATTPITKLPDTIVAGQAFQLEFSVLQHGTKPISSIDTDPVKPLLTAEHATSEAFQQVWATQVGALGNFQATLQLPSAGEWEISIKPLPFGTIEGEIYRITVQEAAAPQIANVWYLGIAAGGLGLAVGMGWLIKRIGH
ncbi:hypothetical protein [Herpetosiphon geysericola]|uniref:YtkA-like domain-containing protein n=1 Tax=Herpetosiphon geysericola TaxID=70996 RepID=A0A0P6YFT7_9CHLR|nr:hypothetical protein [Herpetosiphon geysericola]KPL91043.1 hypothetical protein SE18_04640 [Herpetosiphon geysericola]